VYHFTAALTTAAKKNEARAPTKVAVGSTPVAAGEGLPRH
jgi:hypothetical protein